jgi:hypothetical protein
MGGIHRASAVAEQQEFIAATEGFNQQIRNLLIFSLFSTANFTLVSALS